QQPVERNPTQATTAAAPEEPAEVIPDFVGVVTSRNSTVLPAAFTGRINRHDAMPGKIVHKGDVLAHLDETQIRGSIKEGEAQVKAGRAQSGAASMQAAAVRVDLKSAQIMQRMHYGSNNAVASAKANMAASGAQAGVGAAQAAQAMASVEVMKDKLARATIVSPIDGVVMVVKAKEGEQAQEGAPIVRVFDPSDLLVRFGVPKAYRSRIKMGARVQLNVEGLDHPVWATVQEVNQELEPPMSFTVVVADIDDSKLNPGELTVAAQAHVKLADMPTAAAAVAVAPRG
ncbi:MAG: HlyD family efflux transporter periplasmic adaptor subunit, partial [Thermoleophilia bacterium]|nr:HlyD family efflux transporter periplasmic adaptor subunit [Thermoleophilia bacterium]